MDDALLTYTKHDATFDPPIVSGIVWSMGVPGDEESGPQGVASVAGSILLEEDRDNTPFNLRVTTPKFIYHFKNILLPNGGRAGGVKTFLVNEIEIEEVT